MAVIFTGVAPLSRHIRNVEATNAVTSAIYE